MPNVGRSVRHLAHSDIDGKIEMIHELWKIIVSYKAKSIPTYNSTIPLHCFYPR
jgi:hypothetical protein